MIVSTSRSLLNCAGETLTATDMCAGQVIASRQAWRMTHSPIGTISPISSASGMKSAGETSPRSGCRQRIRASQPISFSLSSCNCGW